MSLPDSSSIPEKLTKNIKWANLWGDTYADFRAWEVQKEDVYIMLYAIPEREISFIHVNSVWIPKDFININHQSLFI